jgi:hypothetical protein
VAAIRTRRLRSALRFRRLQLLSFTLDVRKYHLMNVIRHRFVFRPLTRQFSAVAFLFCLSSVPGIGFLSSGYGRVLPWASTVFLVLLALHGAVFIVTVLLLMFEKPVTIHRAFLDPNYRDHEL